MIKLQNINKLENMTSHIKEKELERKENKGIMIFGKEDSNDTLLQINNKFLKS